MKPAIAKINDFKQGDMAWFVGLENHISFTTLYNINIICAEYIGIDDDIVRLVIVRDGVTVDEYRQPLDCIFKSYEDCLCTFITHLTQVRYHEE